MHLELLEIERTTKKRAEGFVWQGFFDHNKDRNVYPDIYYTLKAGGNIREVPPLMKKWAPKAEILSYDDVYFIGEIKEAAKKQDSRLLFLGDEIKVHYTKMNEQDEDDNTLVPDEFITTYESTLLHFVKVGKDIITLESLTHPKAKEKEFTPVEEYDYKLEHIVLEYLGSEIPAKCVFVGDILLPITEEERNKEHWQINKDNELFVRSAGRFVQVHKDDFIMIESSEKKGWTLEVLDKYMLDKWHILRNPSLFNPESPAADSDNGLPGEDPTEESEENSPPTHPADDSPEDTSHGKLVGDADDYTDGQDDSKPLGR